MTVKTTGSEFKRFYNDDAFWPSETYHDDTILSVNGVVQEDGIVVEELSDSDQVTIEGGYVVGAVGGGSPTMEAYFKKWKKQQTSTTFVVECDVNQLAALKELIKAAGGKIL